MKSKLAYAIVSKKRPTINIMEIYSKEQVKEIEIGKDEEIVKVIIMARNKG